MNRNTSDALAWFVSLNTMNKSGNELYRCRLLPCRNQTGRVGRVARQETTESNFSKHLKEVHGFTSVCGVLTPPDELQKRGSDVSSLQLKLSAFKPTEATSVDDSLIDLVIAEKLPLALIESGFFDRFISKLHPSTTYSTPSMKEGPAMRRRHSCCQHSFSLILACASIYCHAPSIPPQPLIAPRSLPPTSAPNL